MRKLLVFFLLAFISSVESSHYEFNGIHYIASYLDCDHEALCNLTALQGAMIQGVEASGATILDVSEHVFPPHSITMVFLLSESHASIHTYPEYGSCYIDLFTCGENCDYRKFEEVIEGYLKPKSIENHIMRR